MVIVRFADQFMPTKEQASLRDARLGIPRLDILLESHNTVQIKKFLPTFGQETSSAGRYLERTFVIYFKDGTDPAQLVAELSRLPYFEEVMVNKKLTKNYHGTKQSKPDDDKFGDQWNLHHEPDDGRDIDAPEAWAIEKGDTNIIIGIIDYGTMIDLGEDGVHGNDSWGLHSDLRFYFNDPEDNSPKKEVGKHDLDGSDANDIDTLRLADNVIGYSFVNTPRVITDTLETKFWGSMPHNWIYKSNPPSLFFAKAHGIGVTSIAAAIATYDSTGGNYIAGIANGCRVYTIRDRGDTTSVVDEANAVYSAADFADVINMSWGFDIDPGTFFRNAIIYAAVDMDRVLVASTGNDPPDDVDWPAIYPQVLGVGNVAADLDSLYDSQYGPDVGDVSVVAPVGAGIPANWVSEELSVTNPLDQDIDFTLSVMNNGGTSAAAPQAAGVAALIRSRFPNLDQQEVRERIMHSAEWYWSNSQSDSIKYGHGKINAYRALTEWGEITESTIWDFNDTRDSTFYVSGDLTITSGDTLTIVPGTTIKIAPDHERTGADTNRVQIIVKGSLRVGSGGEDVIIESFTDATSTETDWVGIFFDSTSQNNNLDGLVIRHAQVAIESEVPLTIDNCTIEQCSVAVKTDTTITIRDSELLDLTGYGVYAAGGTLTIASTDFEGPDSSYGLTGVKLMAGVAQASVDSCAISRWTKGIDTSVDLTVEDCTISACTTAGIWSWEPLVVRRSTVSYGVLGIAGDDSVTVENCTITHAGTSAVSFGIASDVATVRNSAITASTYAVDIEDGLLVGDTLTSDNYGIRIDGTVTCRETQISGESGSLTGIVVSSSTDSLHLRETEISGFDTGVYLASSARGNIDSCTVTDNDVGIEVYSSSNVSIRNSLFDENDTDGIYCHWGSDITIEGNTITDNSVGVYCLDNSDALIQDENVIEDNSHGIDCDEESDPTIRSNKISSNTVGVWADNDSDPDLGVACGASCDTTGACSTEGRNKITSNTSHHVVNRTVGLTLTAECNYWGKSGPKPNKFSGSVDYSPYKSQDPLPDLVARKDGGDGDGGDPDKPTEVLPKVYDIAQNAPNPFNPTTRIRYQVPRPGGDVRIEIYNVRGQVVKTLVRGAKAPGYYTVFWHGRDNRGEPVATGVYFLRMMADQYVQTRKLVLLK